MRGRVIFAMTIPGKSGREKRVNSEDGHRFQRFFSDLVVGVTAEIIVEQLGVARQEGALLISPFVYAELLAYPGATETYVRGFLEATGVVVDYRLEEMMWNESGRRSARDDGRRRHATGEG